MKELLKNILIFRFLLWQLIFLGVSISVNAQLVTKQDTINSIVGGVELFNYSFKLSHQTFHQQKTFNHQSIKEIWGFKQTEKLSLISIEYWKDTTKYIEKYYSTDGVLIYAIENETTYYSRTDSNNTIIWEGQFYFSNRKLIYYETLGHGKSEEDSWDPEKEILTRFDERTEEFKKLKG